MVEKKERFYDLQSVAIRSNKKIYLETLVCSFNQAYSEIMKGLLKNADFQITDNPSLADVIILNTCYVKFATQNRVIHKIKSFQKNFSRKKLVIAGCMTEIDTKMLVKIAPNSSWIGPHKIKYIVDVVNNALNNNNVRLLGWEKNIKVMLPKIRNNPVIAIIQVCEGCSSFCSYCCTRLARGKLFSYPQNLIIKEIKNSLNQGCKEIWLTSQDCGCYGKDKNSSLPELLQSICRIKEKFFIRIGMMNPTYANYILDDLADSYKSEKNFKFLHLPVQSGSDRVLKMMNRGYKIRDFEKIIKKFKKEFPLLTLSTDVIVGFPSEKNKDFQKTVDLIKKIKPDIVNISRFGSRPGTEAAKMNQLSVDIINQRSEKITDVVTKIKLEKNKKWIDWKGEILIDEIKNKNSIGRNFAYKPVVLKKGKLGEFRRIKIVSVSSTSLFGI
jgi:MiaB-like tRNA modifying enzyme